MTDTNKKNRIVDPELGKGSGLLADLAKSLSEDEVKRLARLGYIEIGISPKGCTWRLSKRGKRMRRNLKEATFFTKFGDFFYKYILHYNVNLF